MAEEELELDVNTSKSNKTTTILLIVLIALVLVMGGVGAWLFLGNDDDKKSNSSEKEKIALAPLTYLTLVPEFIVNFGPGSKVRYLQIDLQIATRDEKALKTISIYRPVLRNDILLLLSGLKYEDLKGRNGKKALQQKLLNTINKVIVSAGHTAPASDHEKDKNNDHVKEKATDEHMESPIENVYFTSFIMQ